MLSSLENLNALLLSHDSKNKKLCFTARQISAVFQTSHTLSVRPVLSHVNLAHHNKCLETGDTRSEAKYDDISGGMSSYYERNVQYK